MDEELKRQAEILFEDMGLNMATAMTIFTKAVVRLGKIPFEVAADPFYSIENQNRLAEAAERLQQGKGIAVTMEDLEAMETMTPEEARAFGETAKARIGITT
jgi:DNA-damage-inducible protein J